MWPGESRLNSSAARGSEGSSAASDGATATAVARSIAGIVVDPNGSPAAGAQVALGSEGKGVRILAGGLERQNLAGKPSIVATDDQVMMLMGFVNQDPASWSSMARSTVTTAGGRFVFETVPPRGYGKPVDFTWGMRVLEPMRPEIPLSADGDEMSPSEQRQWSQTPAGRAWRESIQQDPDRRGYAFRIEEDGTFRIEDVVPGKYEFTVLLTEGQTFGSLEEGRFASYRGAMEMPRMAREYADEPLDLGELVLDLRPSQSSLKSPSL